MKCLLTGSKGSLGRELQLHAKDFGIEYISTDRQSLNIINEDSVCGYRIGHYRQCKEIDAVIHCASYTDVPGAEKNRVAAIEANIIGTKNISNLICNVFSVSLVYISTDYVYPGIDGNYTEESITSPINFYAITKLAGEAFAGGEKDLIIRTSFKPNVWKYSRAFSDIYTSADYTDTIARKISLLISKKARGTYNVGTSKKSIYELAIQRNKDILPMSRNEINDVRMPIDISMNIEKFEAILAE